MVYPCNLYTPKAIDDSSRNSFEAKLVDDLRDGSLDKTDVYAYNVGRALKQAFSKNTTLQAMSDGELRDQIAKFHCGFTSGKGVAISDFDVKAFIANLGGTSSTQTPGGGSSAAPGNGGSTQTPGNGGSSTVPGDGTTDVDEDLVNTAPGGNLDGDDVKEDDGTNWAAWIGGGVALAAVAIGGYIGYKGLKKRAAAKTEKELAAIQQQTHVRKTAKGEMLDPAHVNDVAARRAVQRDFDAHNSLVARSDAAAARHLDEVHAARQQELDDVFGDPANKAKLDAAEGKVAGHTGGNTSVDDYYAAQGKRYNSATGMYEDIPGFVPPAATSEFKFGNVESPVNVKRPPVASNVQSPPDLRAPKPEAPGTTRRREMADGTRTSNSNLAAGAENSGLNDAARDLEVKNRAADRNARYARRAKRDAQQEATGIPRRENRVADKERTQVKKEGRQLKEETAAGGHGYHERKPGEIMSQRELEAQRQRRMDEMWDEHDANGRLPDDVLNG